MNYPLPPFVMLEILEIEEVNFGRGFKISLVDKKHDEFLDCNYVWKKYKLVDVEKFAKSFKQSLYDNGVI